MLRYSGTIGRDRAGWIDGGPARVLSPESLHREMRMNGSSVQNVIKYCTAIFIFIGCMIGMVPFQPAFPRLTLDDGWKFALNQAVENGLRFGHDIVFTLGPYAADYTRQYNPATDTRMLWSSAFLAMALAVGLISLSRDRYHRLALALVLFFFQLNVSLDAILFAIPIVFIMMAFKISLPAGHPDGLAPTPWIRAEIVVLAIALSLMSLVKVTFFANSVLVISLGCVALVIGRHRRLAICLAASYVVAIVLFWVIANQHLSDLPAFLMSQIAIASGYNDAMSLVGSRLEVIMVLVGLLVIASLEWRALLAGGRSGVVLAVGMAALAFLGLKAGFVRDDPTHLFIGPGVIAVAAFVMAIGSRGLRPILGVGVALCCWLAIDARHTGWDMIFRTPRVLMAAMDGISTRLSGDAGLRAQFDNSLRIIRDRRHLPEVTGTTDIYSFGQSILLAYDLKWRPRPVFQSYLAYNPELLRANARHLDGANAPDNILFAIEPIDHRFPALEDGASWPSLLARYDPTALSDGIAVLRRRPDALSTRSIGFHPLGSGTFEVGEQIPIPPDVRAVWAEINIGPSVAGRLFAAAYRPPQLWIRFLMSDGQTLQFRYVAGMGETGFVVSPIVTDTADFLALELPDMQTYFANSRPRSMAVTVADRNAWAWRSQLSARLFSLDIPPSPDVRRLVPTLQARTGD